MPIRLVGGLADSGGGCREPHPGYAGDVELLIDVTAGLSIEMPGFTHYRFGDPLVQVSGDQLAVGVGELTPQRPRGV
jgi:hypothetical protein